jgi:oligopeptide/dipeptide ABC transporter ATP-binding protein
MTLDSSTLAQAPAPLRRARALRLPRSPKVVAGLAIIGAFAVVAIIGRWITPYSPNETDTQNWVQHVLVPGTGGDTGFPANYYPLPLPPSAEHWLGTTVFAQDVLSQLLASTQATMFVGLVAAALATLLSIGFGVTAGYIGGKTDDALSLIANVFLAIPGLPLLIVLADYVPSAGSSIALVAAIIAVTTWAWSARTLRAQTLSLRNRDFVEASRVAGEGPVRIMFAEILPNLLPIVASSFVFTTLTAIYFYVAISFLGLAGSPTGSPPGLWNWGEMLREGLANNAVRGGWWWWWAPPGILVALLGTGLALLNFGIDEFINPRLRDAGLSVKAASKAGIKAGTLAPTPVIRSAARRAAAPAVSDAVLEIRGLSVDYGYGDGAVHAVSDCDLVLRRGRVLGLAGESGSGKTSLALAAVRLLRAPAVITGGQVLFHSRPLSPGGVEGTVDLLAAGPQQLRELRWSEIAVVLQSSLNSLNPVITIGAQFDDMLRAHRPHMDRDARRTHELSGGMRQRAMIAMALALEPQVMILDEPTTALDVVTQREVLDELMGLRDRLGFAALFITHDLSLLVELADDIAVMYAGRVMERAAANALFRAPRLPYTHGLLHCFPPMHGRRVQMEGIPGSPPDLHDLPSGCPFHPRCRWALDRCKADVPVLQPVGRGGREVACWLHRDGAVPPAELSLPDPVGAPSARLSEVSPR